MIGNSLKIDPIVYQYTTVFLNRDAEFRAKLYSDAPGIWAKM